MSNQEFNILIGELIDHNERIELAEFRKLCRISEDFLFELIEEGIIEPEIDSSTQFLRAIHLHRVKKANRLNRELGVNVAGIALILELLERIETLERLSSS